MAAAGTVDTESWYKQFNSDLTGSTPASKEAVAAMGGQFVNFIRNFNSANGYNHAEGIPYSSYLKKSSTPLVFFISPSDTNNIGVRDLKSYCGESIVSLSLYNRAVVKQFRAGQVQYGVAGYSNVTEAAIAAANTPASVLNVTEAVNSAYFRIAQTTANKDGTINSYDSTTGAGLVPLTAYGTVNPINMDGYDRAIDKSHLNFGDQLIFAAGENATVEVVDSVGGNVTTVIIDTKLPEFNKGVANQTITMNGGGNTFLNLSNPSSDTFVTAADLANYGWIVGTPQDNKNWAVRNANTVNFIGKGLSVTSTENTTTGAYDVTIESKVNIDSKATDDGYTITITDANGTTKTLDIKNGAAGATGATGATEATGEKGDKGDAGDTSWNIGDNNGELVENIANEEQVNFVNGVNTETVVESTPEGGANVSINVNTAELSNTDDNGKNDGSVLLKELASANQEFSSAIVELASASTNEEKAAAQSKVDLATTKLDRARNALVTAENVQKAINDSGWNVHSQQVEGSTGVVTADSTQEATIVKPSNTVNINAGNNIVITRKARDIAIATSDNPVFSSVQVGGSTGPKISATQDGHLKVAKSDGSAARITNVAEGVAPTDAVNVSQLEKGLGNVQNQINKVDKDLRGGIAGATAVAGLYHATLPGKSMVSAGAGTYKGESAVALGYSRLSDNGKVGVKFSLHTNTRGDTGAAASIGYQW